MFEMLGNFSFGEYFKRESIAWGFELVTERWGVDPDRLWVTVYVHDAEAREAWLDVGMPPERIVPRDKVDEHGEPANYWWTHAAGPAGPCSEIFVDRGPKYGPEGGPNVDEERFEEIWNHVFIQEQVDAESRYVADLPAKNIDTGSSLERVVTVLQGLDSFYEADHFRPLVEVAESLAGKKLGEDERSDVSLKVIAEHGRATTFLIADGVQPSNEGRGYILRRMLRRVVSHARRLGIEKPVMEPLVLTTVELMGHAYPELRENQAFALQVAGSEEERFAATLRQGMTLFRGAAERTPSGGTIAGDDVFKLFDTFGFPPQLTEELAAEAGLSVDMERFGELMEEQRRRARDAAKKVPIGLDAGAAPPTEFVGYERLEADASVAALLDPEFRELEVAEEGDEVRLFLDATPFYGESGGQVGDAGIVRTDTGIVRVTDAQWAGPQSILHAGVVESGEIRPGQQGHAEVDTERRAATARAHTSTHIVHWTLKHLLGEHARQAGSLVAPGRLRFDFPHPSAVPAELLEGAEEEANRRLALDDPVRIYETTFDEAKAQGAVMLFGEKYGDLVRVVEVGDYSKELCGGTHVPSTGTIALIRILHEGSIGAGMRRVEALVGPDALREINVERELLRGVVQALGAGDPQHAPDRARELVEHVRRLEAELNKLRRADVAGAVDVLVGGANVVAGARLVATSHDADADELRELAQKSVQKLDGEGGGAVVLGSDRGGKALLVAACSATLVSRGVTAPRLLERAAALVGGGAGGKDILAFAGGPNADAVPDALGAIPARLEELLTA
jgi:alanyl-tRNA synthetase